jgi:hypothetical protein
MCSETNLNIAVIFILLSFFTKQVLTTFTIYKSIMF